MSEFFEDLSGVNLSELSNCEVQDANGERVGRLIDAVLTQTDKGLDLTKFIVGDSKLVEFLEKIKLRPDVDPVFAIDVIKKVSRSRIQLKVAKSDLKSTHIHEDALIDGEYRLDALRKAAVIDSNGENIGRVIDLTFDNDKFHLILGDSAVTEWAESIGLREDLDFLISPSYIKEFSKDKIVLTKERDELKSTFVKNLDVYQRDKQEQKQVLEGRKTAYFPTVF